MFGLLSRHYEVSNLLELQGWNQYNDERVGTPKSLPPLRHKNSKTGVVTPPTTGGARSPGSPQPDIPRRTELPPPRYAYVRSNSIPSVQIFLQTSSRIYLVYQFICCHMIADQL